MSQRRKSSAEFKAKVALEARSGELTLAEWPASTTCIRHRRRQAKEGMVAAFSGKTAAVQFGISAKIGQLTVEKDFLERALAKR